MKHTEAGPLFNFFEVVQVVDVDGKLPLIDRKFGVVLGMSKDAEGQWGYAVDVYEDITCTVRLDCWDIQQGSLVATGKSVNSSHIYDDRILRVPPK